MTHKQAAFAAATENIIKNLEKRGMEGYFFEDSASCTDAILASIPESSIISWGGSESIKETGLMVCPIGACRLLSHEFQCGNF